MAARAYVVADFEEGVDGIAVPPNTGKPPAAPDAIVPTNDVKYTTESHSGSLAARITGHSGFDRLSLNAIGPKFVGGGGWLKFKSSLSGEALAGAEFLTPGPGPQYGVYLRHVGSSLKAFDEITDLEVNSIALPADQWIELKIDRDCNWSVGNAGGSILMSGTTIAPADISGFTWQAYAQATGDVTLVDDIYVYLDHAPVTRLYPRDDGRGMSSAPRIWPPPRGRSRIIGGFQ